MQESFVRNSFEFSLQCEPVVPVMNRYSALIHRTGLRIIIPLSEWILSSNMLLKSIKIKIFYPYNHGLPIDSRPSNADWPIKANADHHASVLHSLFCPHFWGIICCDFVPPMIPITTTSSVAYSKRHISDITLRQCSTWGFPLREGRLIQPYSHSLKTSVA